MTKISSGEYGRMPPDVVRTFYPRYFGEVVDAECVRYGLDPLFVHALIRQESVYNPAIVSFAGAIGLMQLMPATAGEEAGRMKIEFARDSLFNPVYNIRIGVHHVDDLFGRLEQKNEWVLCAYNAGLSATRTWIRKNRKLEYDDFVEEIAYTETRGYVKKCMQNYWLYQQYWQ